MSFVRMRFLEIAASASYMYNLQFTKYNPIHLLFDYLQSSFIYNLPIYNLLFKETIERGRHGLIFISLVCTLYMVICTLYLSV